MPPDSHRLGFILFPMLEDMRRYARAGIEALAAQRPEGVGDLAMRAQAVAEQFASLASGFLEWSAEARDSILREIKDLVAAQVREMGVATKREVQSLRKRIEELEAQVRDMSTNVPGQAAAHRKETGGRSSSRPIQKSSRAGSKEARAASTGSRHTRTSKTSVAGPE